MVPIFKLPVLFTCIIILQLLCSACQQAGSDTKSGAVTSESANEIATSDGGLATDGNTDVENSHQADLDLGSKVVNYAGSLANVPYKEAGRDTSGFDCSGFVYYVFKNFDIDVPHSSRHIAMMGRQIEVTEAKEGDLIFFRGTDPASTEVGHIGIVVSQPGEKVKFIHSSSAISSPFVRFDSLEKPNYKKRFLMVKRILDNQM